MEHGFWIATLSRVLGATLSQDNTHYTFSSHARTANQINYVLLKFATFFSSTANTDILYLAFYLAYN